MIVAGTLSIAGVVDERVSFHYDPAAEVPYLRLVDHLESPAIGEDTHDDLVLLRHEDTDAVIGMDVISWWKRFGQGASPDSLREVECRLEPMAQRLLAEAGRDRPSASR